MYATPKNVWLLFISNSISSFEANQI
jgi:hypothetical protein